MKFEDRFNLYYANLKKLDTHLVGKNIEDDYYIKWKNTYKKYFKEKNQKVLNCLGIRIYRAKKEMFCSTQIFFEALESRDNGCLVAYYYLCYYSLLHAMQAVLFLNINIVDNRVIELSHNNIKKYFEDYYCKGGKAIISQDIIKEFEKLKLYREFYSYTMPFNYCGVEKIETDKIKEYLEICFELTNMHSIIIFEVRKTGVETRDKLEIYKDVKRFFYECSSKVNPNTKEMLLDEADKAAFSEMINKGIDYTYISLGFDHDFDEFGGYSTDAESDVNYNRLDKIRSKVRSFVYHTICN